MATALDDKPKNISHADLVKMIKDVAGQVAGETVKTQMEAAVSPHQKLHQELVERLTGGKGADEPPKREKGLGFGRICRAVAVSRMRGGGEEMIVRTLTAWGDKDLADQMVGQQAAARARVEALGQIDPQFKALAAGSALEGGVLVPIQQSQDIIELLRPASVVRSLNPVVLQMPTGTLRIPKITAGSTATYIGENMNIPISQPAFGQVLLTFKKLVAMVPMSNDLVRYSSPGADAIVRDDVVRSMATRENQAFLSDDGTQNTPRGLKFQANAANVVTGTDFTAADNGANIITVLAGLIMKLRAANVPITRGAWIMSPQMAQRIQMKQTTNGVFLFQEMMTRGSLFGYPVGITTQVGATEIYFVDFADVVIGESLGMIVDASMEASYFDGTALQSTFSLDQTVIRAIAEHDLGVRRDISIAYSTGNTV